MFGGKYCEFPRDRLQCGAIEENCGRTTFTNLNLTSDVKEASIFNLFIFKLELIVFVGRWLDLELSGQRQRPLQFAAMAPIDRCRGFIFGMDSDDDSHSFVLNLYSKVSCEVDK